MDGSETASYRRIAPGWAWVRDNFSLPAVVSLAGVILAAGAGYLDQRAELKAIRRADPTQRLERIEADLQKVLAEQAAQHQRLEDLSGEVGRQRELWDRVERVAESAPGRRRRP